MVLKLLAFLIFCFAELAIAASVNNYNPVRTLKSNDVREVSSTSSSLAGLFNPVKNLFWSSKGDDAANGESYEKAKKEKEENMKRIENQVKKYESESLEDNDKEYLNVLKPLIQKVMLNKNKEDHDESEPEEDENTFNFNRLMQEAILHKINDSADDFDSLNNIRSKLQYGDIVEFKRMGYSHFSIYFGNNRVVEYKNVKFDNVSVLDIFSNFPSQTVISVIDVPARGGGLVRVNNKKQLNLPVNMTALTERIEEALKNNGTVPYNFVFSNCEHFAMWVRFGFGFSDQINALFGLGTYILYPVGKLTAHTFDDLSV